MYILGIESSCDETSAAVVEADGNGRRIAADIVAPQIDIHRLYGGVVPEIAGRAHIEAVTRITHEALDDAGITLGDVGLVAVTSHPGLIGALLVGVNFAKSLAVANGIPLVGVDHVRAHIAAAYAAYPDLAPPFLGVVLSGGHTSFYIVDGYASFHEIGSTRDDAAGEAFDKIGRVIGMPYPGGAAMDALAYEGDPHAYKLPSPALAGDTLDFSFSGLKTSFLYMLRDAVADDPDFIERNKADLCASLQGTIVEILLDKLVRASKDTGIRDIAIAGGVSANSGLRNGIVEQGLKRGWRTFLPEFKFTTDNAAMIAMAGYYHYQHGDFSSLDVSPVARLEEL